MNRWKHEDTNIFQLAINQYLFRSVNAELDHDL